MNRYPLDATLETILAERPADSPAALSAWTTAQFADRIIQAVRAGDMGAVRSVAREMEKEARRVQPSLINTDPVEAEDRQSIYAVLGEDERRMILRLRDMRPVPTGLSDLNRTITTLVEQGLVDMNWNLTARGSQIAEGVARRWPESKDV